MSIYLFNSSFKRYAFVLHNNKVVQMPVIVGPLLSLYEVQMNTRSVIGSEEIPGRESYRDNFDGQAKPSSNDDVVDIKPHQNYWETTSLSSL